MGAFLWGVVIREVSLSPPLRSGEIGEEVVRVFCVEGITSFPELCACAAVTGVVAGIAADAILALGVVARRGPVGATTGATNIQYG